MINIEEKRTTILKDIFRRAYAIISLIEAFYIGKNKPDLNKQLHHFNTFLTLTSVSRYCNALGHIVTNLFILCILYL